jgi:hypothetical protein
VSHHLSPALLLIAAAACVSPSRPQQRATLLYEHGAPAIQLLAPEGFRIEWTLGPDFSVTRLLPNGVSADEKRGITVYAGNYPSRRPQGGQLHGRIAGKEIVWACRENSCETLVEGLVDEGPRPNPTVLHVSVVGRDEAEVAAYRRLAELHIVSVQ